MVWLCLILFSIIDVTQVKFNPYNIIEPLKVKKGKSLMVLKLTLLPLEVLAGYMIHGMFYNKGRKVIPKNIYEYLILLILIIWCLSHGKITNRKIELSTNFSVEKNVENSNLIISMLRDRFGLFAV